MRITLPNALLRVLQLQPLKRIASSTRTPRSVLNFMLTAGNYNPFNSGYVPSLWETILANPNIDVNHYYDKYTRLCLHEALASNPSATNAQLNAILKENEQYYTNNELFKLKRALKNNPNYVRTPEAVQK